MTCKQTLRRRPLAAAVFLFLAAFLMLPGHAGEAADREDPPEDKASPGQSSSAPEEGLIVGDASPTVTSALQGKEGVRIQTLCTHCNSANIQVGGLSQDLVPMSQDGFPVIGGLATSLVLTVLPADTIAEAEVVKGPGEAAEPSQAAGGVIALTGTDPGDLPWLDVNSGSGSFDRQYANLRLAGELTEQVTASVTFGMDKANPIDDDNNGFNDVGRVDREFYDARTTIALGLNHTLNLATDYIGEDNFNARGAFDIFGFLRDGEDQWTREDTLLERRSHRAGWTWTQRNGGTLAVRGLTADREQRVLSQLTAIPDLFGPGSDQLFDRFQIEEENHWVGASYDRPIGFAWRISTGIESSYQRVAANSVNIFTLIGGGTPDEAEEAEDKVELQSAYFDAGWAPSTKFDMLFGVRYDDVELSHDEINLGRVIQNTQEDSQVSPRVTMRWFPSSGWTLRFLAGRTFRPPKPILAEVCCGQSYQDSSSARPETATTVGLETIFQPDPEWRVSAYMARTEFDDHLLRLVAWSQLFIQTYALANVGEAQADTAEIAMRYTPGGAGGRLQLDTSIGWLDFTNTGDRNVPVEVAPPSFATTQTVLVPMDEIPYRPERTGSIAATYRFADKYLVSIGGNYTGEMWIQQFNADGISPNGLEQAFRRTDDFWIGTLSAVIPLNESIEFQINLDNFTDEIQNDLGDPTTDFNWGPLAGRTWSAGLRVHLNR